MLITTGLITAGAGILSAILYATAATGVAASLLPMLLAPLPLFMVGLSVGARAAQFAGLVGAAAIGVAGGSMIGLAYLLSNALAPMLLCHFALLTRQSSTASDQSIVEWYPPGMLFAWLSVLGIVLLIGFSLIIQSFDGGLRGWIASAAQIDTLTATLIQTQIQAGQPAFDEAVLRERLITLALPGLGIFWSGLALANGALAQYCLVRIKRHARPTPAFLSMDLPTFMRLVLLAGTGASLLPGDMGLTGLAVMSVAAIPYFFLGLACVHVISRPLPARAIVLTVFYVLLVALGWPCLLVVGLGVAEQFAGLRNRAIAQLPGPRHKED